MKKNLIKHNPTAYFLQQSANPTQEHREKINELVSKLIDLNACVLCKGEYNLNERIPRILIHCGHTFCSSCLKNFHKNRRIRCPLCLKLIKNIDSLDRLPVNHTIFSKMAEELKEKSRKDGHISRIQKIDEFTHEKFMAPMTAALQGKKKAEEEVEYNDYNAGAGDVKDPQDIEWEYCGYHTDRIKHFFCTTHQSVICRVCSEVMHARPECKIVDLYETEDVATFMNYVNEMNKVDKKLFEGAEDEVLEKSTNSV